MLIILSLYEAVTVSAWAGNLPSMKHAQVHMGAPHEHCPDAMEESMASGNHESHPDSTQPHPASRGHCNPGACHCAFLTPPGDVSTVSWRVPAIHVVSIAAREQVVAPAPLPQRHFRPPIQ